MRIPTRTAAFASCLALSAFGLSLAATAAPSSPASIEAAATPSADSPSIIISEIVYNGPGSDAVEILNVGSEPVDLDGWSLHDDKDRPGLGDLHGTLEPGEYLVLTQVDDAGNGDFDFGLGKGDRVEIRDADGAVVDSYMYDATAPLGAWARCGDGIGDWAHATRVTLGGANDCTADTPEPSSGSMAINEIDSAPADWVEFVNPGDEPLDISGYEIRDNSDDHRWRFPDGTVIQPGQHLVVDAKSDGLVFNDQTGAYDAGTFETAIGIGSGDSIRLFDTTGKEIDSFSWQGHAAIDGDEAAATFGRSPDGVGTFALTEATPGEANILSRPLVTINEIESNGDATDWVEITNTSSTPVDISGWTVMDNDPVGHAADVIPVPEGTVLQPGEMYVFDTGTHFGFGLGKNDHVELRNRLGARVDIIEWGDHSATTLGRCPDGTGDVVDTAAGTKGAPNACDGDTGEQPTGPDTEDWPGAQDPTVLDEKGMFLEDSSGLDYRDGVLWAIDNGTGTIWKLNAAADGTVSFADGWADGKRGRFQRDAENPSAAGPDTEGITAASDGLLYAASERDNGDKGVNQNTILQVDPNAAGPDVVASAEWDLTELLPQVSANTGIEAVEFADGAGLEGAFVDQATGKPFTIGAYPDAVSGGVFFTALEANGHVYAFVLHPDGTATLVADLATGIDGAMALDYREGARTLVVHADDGFDGVTTRLALTGGEPEITHLARPAGLPNSNHEGMAISDVCDGDQRAVWFFEDGVKAGALTTVMADCDAFGAVVEAPAPGQPEPGQPEPGQPEQPGEPERPGDASANAPGKGGADAPGTAGAGSTGSAQQPAQAAPSGVLARTGAEVGGLIAAAGGAIGLGIAMRARKVRLKD
ncbi:lamin tail domain-containing protein [Helcobacillus massiliensis]|uniref:LTD domain-containing protein n=1 Tax=Helcobacillus massiliensis TaxID=521392 RepID=A0A839QSY9_9MICO|nr:lamin tail domain-containing protein [Helcobacillus massiliensis]MBB3023613.1 hypothetical protein [Helcobacillus massiliensis]